MTEPVYREGYRVEERTRSLSPEEETLVRDRRAQWEAAAKKSGVRTAAKGPYTPPDGGWQVRELVVVARSVVGAASGDEDYVTWLLFEIPGAAWVFFDPACLPEPYAASVASIARARLRVTMLSPNGVTLAVEASGDPIPHHGADLSEDGYADAVERGFVWRPEDEWVKGNADGLVPEAALPAWIREATRAP